MKLTHSPNLGEIGTVAEISQIQTDPLSTREPLATLPWFRSMVFEWRSAGEKSYHTIRALAWDWKRRVKGSDVRVVNQSEGAADLYYYR